jgi:hypothetical protein
MISTVTEAENTFCMYKLGLAGSGMTSLINAIFALDKTNRAKLAKGYPELVEVVNKYNYDNDYWSDLVKRWNSESMLTIEL